MPVEYVHNGILIIIPDDIKSMSNDQLLFAVNDVELQRDDYGLAFDVYTYELELKAERLRRRI